MQGSAQHQTEYPLADQGFDVVLDQRRLWAVGETPGQTLDQPDRPVGRPRQQSTGVTAPPSNAASNRRP